jgi:anaerobic selenocysteine-containing dehydrogenase
MGVSRRDFLKLTGATAVAGAVGGAGEAQALERENRLNGAKATTSICPY